MSKKIHECKKLSELNLDRLIAVKELAVKLGYCQYDAKAQAMCAVERHRQGGACDYLNIIYALKRGTARCNSKYQRLRAEAYDRLVAGYVPKKIRKGTHKNQYGWSPICRTEVRALNPKTKAPKQNEDRWE